VIVDLDTLLNGLHHHSILETNSNGTLSISTLRQLACEAAVIPMVMNSDGVILDVGRSQRLATPTQRQALRAMYPTCAHPGCRVRFEDCTIHHTNYWENGGRTDLGELLPLCSHHHHDAHHKHWRYTLDPDRTLHIHRPDGTHHSTNPPPRKRVA
jgi:hypothetical protein